ncbi:hypothetical protein Cob_v006578 [Colletotrichum orbiculare MAFF 240422]|uniref:Uncharacterized protein n=1 Tax=Colletotrichum orbiculare (strain 104-T / ATCC 96160 / CBS 514.97 / LARS 414 / MAFF 240422) TaxID=1213857 RepID=A0A484FQA1_COLOR|nr:hypothetical protein Cob_v006578 [Colletotrichum orbiculare MAFF 240422]
MNDAAREQISLVASSVLTKGCTSLSLISSRLVILSIGTRQSLPLQRQLATPTPRANPSGAARARTTINSRPKASLQGSN